MSNEEQNGNCAKPMLAVRLIANFMGWVNSPYDNLPNSVYTPDLNKGIPLDQLKYNESWDELMPVCRKIRDILDSIKRPSQNHCCKGDIIEVGIHCALQSIDILETHKYVVEFIEWWNASEFFEADR